MTNVQSDDIRCYQRNPGTGASGTYNVTAGQAITYNAKASISHPGPMAFYIAKVPAGQTAATWDGKGQVWSKIYQDMPSFGGGLKWPTQGTLSPFLFFPSHSLFWSLSGVSAAYTSHASTGVKSVSVTIPRCLQNGEYLLRAEHIGLHSAGSAGGAQFYISCAQLSVSGGSGTYSPKSLVSFPGAYKATDPGIMINIYYPVPTSYQPPGPAAESC